MKQRIRYFCLTLLVMVAGLTSAQDVVEISTVNQLKEFRNAVNSGNTYAGKTVKLTADLDLSGENWKPIGNVAAYPGQAFQGVFDGNGKTISNLTSNDETANWSCAGLFGSISNGTIKDLTLTNVNIQSYHYAAGIVAYKGDNTNVLIQNCKVIGGTITSTPELLSSGKYDNGDKVGGIMGYATAGSTINNCTVEGVNISGYRDLGGIVGMANGTSSVTGCTASNVTIIQDNENGYKSYAEVKELAGGIVGRTSANATISDNTSSNITITHVNYGVAKIRDVEYETIDAAVAAANEGETIEVIVAGDYKLPNLPKNVTIEGKADGAVSFTYTTSDSSIASVPNGATFKNVTFNWGNVNYHGFQHAGTINMEGCTLNGKFFSYADMNFTNCEFVHSGDYNMWVYGQGNVLYDGCTFTNNTKGKMLHLYCEDANQTHKVTVKNCKFVNKGELSKSAINVKATSGSNALQYELHLEGNNTYEGSFPTAVGEQDNSDHTWILSPLAQVDDRSVSPDNIKVFENDVLIYPVSYVAKIDTKKYESLEAAWADVQDGQTITLLKDCAGNGIKAQQGKFTTGITVDFDGHTYTMDGSMVGSTGTETQAFQLLKDNKITFKGGTIYSEKAYMLIQNYSDLTLEGMTLTLKNENYNDAYTLSDNNGNIVIDGTTINANPAGSTAFDVCRYSRYTSVNVTVKGESVINGDIEVDAGAGDPKNGMFLTVESGTINGNLRLTEGGATAITDNAEKAAVKKSNEVTLAAPADYKWKDNGDGTSTLVPCEYICAIGTTKYETLADAVAAAGTAETTITLLTEAATDDVITGNGVKVQAGQNITFNLNGLTYNVGKTVGSAGTETNGFQLLKGSTVKFTNGTLTSATAQILLQNYSDLTLDGVTVNAGSADYAVSNNFGSLTVTGETNINAKSGGCAFDLWYSMSRVYDDGISIVFDEKFTGSVTGKVEYGHHSSATNEDWRDKTKLEIKAGKFDIEFANGSAGALDGANIKISGGVFAEKPADEYCAEGYIVTDNTDDATKADYRYAVKTKEEAGIYELKDNTPYPENLRTNGGHATEVTYTRSFTNAVYSCWCVPFDYTVTEEDASKFDFYKIHMIAGSNNPGEMEESGKIWIFITKQASGKLLKAGHVYVIKPKPKAAVNDYIFKSQDVDLLPENSEKCLKHTETSDYAYDFYGTYVGVTTTKAFEFMALTNKGQIAWNDNAGRPLQQYRWFVRVNSKTGDADADAKISIGFMEGDEETNGINNSQVIYSEIEGIYTLGGMKVEHPVKGVNIVKYTDGRTKKIYVK